MEDRHVLIVPADGILDVIHVTDPDFDLETYFRSLYPTEGRFVTIKFPLPDGTEGTLGFFPAVPNERAREALRILTEAHMVFTGPVIFTGVPSPLLGEVVATLSVND